MKKYVFGMMSVCLALSAEPLVWNAANKFDGWRDGHNAKVQIKEQFLTFTEIKRDSNVRTVKVNIDPLEYDTFTFRYRASGTGEGKGQFYFCHTGESFSDARMWQTPALIADNEWHTASVSPKNQKSWQTGGNVTSLRFDPVNPAGGTIEISELRLEKKSEVAASAASVQGKPGSLNGWKTYRNCNGSNDGNVVKLKDIKRDCSVINSSINVDPLNCNTFTFRYRASGTGKGGGQLYFCHNGESFSDARMWQTPALIADNEWHTVSVSPKDQKSWQTGGMITSLRFDPVDPAGGTIEISELRLEKKDTSAR